MQSALHSLNRWKKKPKPRNKPQHLRDCSQPSCSKEPLLMALPPTAACGSHSSSSHGIPEGWRGGKKMEIAMPEIHFLCLLLLSAPRSAWSSSVTALGWSPRASIHLLRAALLPTTGRYHFADPRNTRPVMPSPPIQPQGKSKS